MLLTFLKAFALVLVTLLTMVGCQTIRNSGNTPLPPAQPETLRMATYNVHYIVLGRATGPWSVGDWERRKGPMDLAFKAVDADVIGFQEMESFSFQTNQINLTLDWLLEN
ncbi:MAG: endonuclease, partial [Pseudomonadota bacterium]